MEPGQTGRDGLTAPRLAEQGEEADQEDAATRRLLMEAETVRDQALSLEFVTQTTVQVQNHVCLELDLQLMGSSPALTFLFVIIVSALSPNHSFWLQLEP